VFRKLALQKESKIEERHLMPDRVHTEMCGVAGRRVHQGKERDPLGLGLRGAQTQLCGAAFWARGFFVNTVGRDEDAIRAHIRNRWNAMRQDLADI
jgi:putative transposase